jgi:Flp pilus assembly protein TadD
MISDVARLGRSLHIVMLVVMCAALAACTTDGTGALDLGLTTGSTVAPTAAPAEVSKPMDYVKTDVELGKDHYRAENYGLAEMHFRRAAESSRGDAEAWLGLAASYDQLKRFELADRAYREVVKLTGTTPELLNNRGYSYLLRGDLRRASQDLSAAAAQDPDNERIRNNLKMLDGRARRKA